MRMTAPRRWMFITSIIMFGLACTLIFRPDVAPQFNHFAVWLLFWGYVIMLLGVVLQRL
ncbi:MAG: hypothetical protein KTR21_08305 [Rhodobacteraceae bacterium]|nr:hypothetical protein [Paracoccaceae bacterium]